MRPASIIGLVLLVAPASLALAQPPSPSDNDLQVMFDARGEPIDAQTEGNVVPTTFQPDCTIEVQFVERWAVFNSVFGWYNVTGSPPQDSPTDLFPLIDSNTVHADFDGTIGDQTFDGSGYRATFDIKDDPRYAGGKIGFFMKTPEGCPDDNAAIGRSCGQLFFSQAQFDEHQELPHLLIYNSKLSRGFYFCFEDQVVGGDGDFSDFVAYVGGVACAGAGAVCDTGLMGTCAKGTMQCSDGPLTCVPQRLPGQVAETCNGLDDDCNGSIDDGVDDGGVPCAATDPCNGVTCGPGLVCEQGVCVASCQCRPDQCLVAQICGADGLCQDTACQTTGCDGGLVCKAGQCVAPCYDVTCSPGTHCQAGRCIPLNGPSENGCGCAVPGGDRATGGRGAVGLLLLLFGLLWWRRRR